MIFGSSILPLSPLPSSVNARKLHKRLKRLTGRAIEEYGMIADRSLFDFAQLQADGNGQPAAAASAAPAATEPPAAAPLHWHPRRRDSG